MVIYGVALLSFCMLVGMYFGDILGGLIGVQANVGGVGIAMLLLMILSNVTRKGFGIGSITEKGIHFWSAMYIPIVVAMAAKQNVIAAVTSGWIAIVAGVAAVVVSFGFIPILDRIHIGEENDS